MHLQSSRVLLSSKVLLSPNHVWISACHWEWNCQSLLWQSLLTFVTFTVSCPSVLLESVTSCAVVFVSPMWKWEYSLNLCRHVHERVHVRGCVCVVHEISFLDCHYYKGWVSEGYNDNLSVWELKRNNQAEAMCLTSN